MKFGFIYLTSVALSVFMVVLKVKNIIDCSYLICLSPVLIISFFLGVTMVATAVELSKGVKNGSNENASEQRQDQ